MRISLVSHRRPGLPGGVTVAIRASPTPTRPRFRQRPAVPGRAGLAPAAGAAVLRLAVGHLVARTDRRSGWPADGRSKILVQLQHRLGSRSAQGAKGLRAGERARFGRTEMGGKRGLWSENLFDTHYEQVAYDAPFQGAPNNATASSTPSSASPAPSARRCGEILGRTRSK